MREPAEHTQCYYCGRVVHLNKRMLGNWHPFCLTRDERAEVDRIGREGL